MWLHLSIFFLILSVSSAQEIVAHRGVTNTAPENSIAAFKEAWRLNVDFIEGDFYLTTDKQIVCFHDKDTQSLKQNLVIEASTWPQLKALDIGTTGKTRGKGHRMPLLSDVLATIPKGKGIFIDIKSEKDIAPYLKKAIDASSVPHDQIQFLSFNVDVLNRCKEIMPNIKNQWLVKIRGNKYRRSIYPNFNQLKQILEHYKIDGVGTNFHHSILTKSNISTLQKAGFSWNVWTINNARKAARLRELGIDYITTDNPSVCR